MSNPAGRPARVGMMTSASCVKRDSKGKRLDDGAEGNTGEAKADEVGVLLHGLAGCSDSRLE